MKKYRYLILLLGVALIAGCSSVNSSNEEPRRWFEPFLKDDSTSLPTISSTAPTAPIAMSLSLSETQIQVGNSLDMTLKVHNTSEDTIAFGVGYGGEDAYYDFVVLRSDSSFVWDKLEYPIVLAQMKYLLAGGESKIFKHRWNLTDDSGLPVPKGKYYVFGGFSGMMYSTDLAIANDPDSGEEVRLGPVATEMQEIIIE